MLGWAQQCRGELCWAALTLIQAWIAAGKPEAPDLITLGMFEAWSRVIGGILLHARVGGFWANLDAFYEVADVEGEALRTFVASWFTAFEDTSVGVFELIDKACEADVELGDRGNHSQRTRLGKLLRELNERVFRLKIGTRGGAVNVRVVRAEKRQGAQLWTLERIGTDREK